MQEWKLAAGIALLAFAIYFRTLQPSVPGGDAGELITAAYLGGVAHPPGYPLYTILAQLFIHLPGGSVAWRVNLLSAVLDSGAAVFLALAASRLTRNVWCGWIAASLFAFSPTVWRYATGAEVFALNNLALAALLFVLVTYGRTRKGALVVPLISGLGLSNHHTFVFYAIPALLWVLIQEKRRGQLSARRLAKAGGLFLLGLLPYLYLPMASAKGAVFSWGDQSSWGGFWKHFLRQEYGTFQLGSSTLYQDGGKLLTRLGHYLKALPREFLMVMPVFGLAGLRVFKKRTLERELGYLLLGATVVYLLVFCQLSNLLVDRPLHLKVEARFWQQANLVLCLFAAAGVSVFADWLGRWKLNPQRILAGLAILVSLGQIGANFRSADQSGNRVFETFGKAILDSLPPEALLLTSGDYFIFPLAYLRFVENYRPDVFLVDEDLLGMKWYADGVRRHFPGIRLPEPGFYGANGFNMKMLLDANSKQRPIAACGALMTKKWDQSLGESYELWSMGLAVGAIPLDQQPRFSSWVSGVISNLKKVDMRVLDRFEPGDWEYEFKTYYWSSVAAFAAQLRLREIPTEEEKLQVLRLGVKMIEDALAKSPEQKPYIYKVLADTLADHVDREPGLRTRAVENYQQFLEGSSGSKAEFEEERVDAVKRLEVLQARR